MDWIYITDEESYPEPLQNVLFVMEDGRVYYGICDADYNWSIELNNENTYYIVGEVVKWTNIDSMADEDKNKPWSYEQMERYR